MGNNTNALIANRITHCMCNHRPFDLQYKVPTTSSSSSSSSSEKGDTFKEIKIRYISMEHTALIVVNDEELQKCHIPAPKVKVVLKTYINEEGEIRNLSGRHSLIRLLCDNIVRRARDPLATTSTALGLMNSKVFSGDVLLLLFGFLEWRDLLHFGFCSQLSYGISNRPELWRLMYDQRFGVEQDAERFVLGNWKN